MKLVSVYEVAADAVLYQLLQERPASANISHKAIPSWEEHKRFLESHPYTAWYLVMKSETSLDVLGSIYLTRDNEIGIFLFKKHQGRGHARQAIRALMKLHPRERYLANIALGNESSLGLFKKLGFVHIQNTYSLES